MVPAGISNSRGKVCQFVLKAEHELIVAFCVGKECPSPVIRKNPVAQWCPFLFWEGFPFKGQATKNTMPFFSNGYWADREKLLGFNILLGRQDPIWKACREHAVAGTANL